MVGGEEKTYKRGMTQAEYTPWLKHLVNDRDLMYAGLADYLNDEKVREALNIPQSAPGWSECSGEVGGKYILQTEASLWIYPILKENNIKMLFYSGETDGAIPTYGTKEWIKDLAWPVTSPWTAWMGDNQQNYGWTTTYADIFTFTIVRGVGHMAPQWARQPVLDMVNDFISSKAEDVSKYYIA
jgi:carboxypeptidase C (cathepsin A)